MPRGDGHSTPSRGDGPARALALRFDDLISEDPYLSISEAARLLGVSLATLRLRCHVRFGMAPARYRLRKRLLACREALLLAVPGQTTIVDIAADYGFIQAGKFSVLYRRTFGEKPSATLAQRSVSVE